MEFIKELQYFADRTIGLPVAGVSLLIAFVLCGRYFMGNFQADIPNKGLKLSLAAIACLLCLIPMVLWDFQ